MVGREVLLRVEKKPAEPGEPLLEVEDLKVLDERGLQAVQGVSFEVRAGEIVGDRRRRRQRAERARSTRSPACASRSERQSCASAGTDVTGQAARERFDAGDGPHPGGPPAARARPRLHARREHRRSTTTGTRPNSKFGWLLPEPADRARAKTLLKEFDVRGGGPQTLAAALSGGNQQKVVIAREVERDPECPRRRLSPRGGSTSARSSSCTAASSRSGTRAAPSCSSRSSSTRSCRSPTGSSSSTRGGSSASTGRTSRRRSSASR